MAGGMGGGGMDHGSGAMKMVGPLFMFGRFSYAHRVVERARENGPPRSISRVFHRSKRVVYTLHDAVLARGIAGGMIAEPAKLPIEPFLPKDDPVTHPSRRVADWGCVPSGGADPAEQTTRARAVADGCKPGGRVAGPATRRACRCPSSGTGVGTPVILVGILEIERAPKRGCWAPKHAGGH